MQNRPAVISPNWWILAVVVLAIVVGAVAFWGIDRTGRQASESGDTFDYNIDEYKRIDPALIHYAQTAEIDVRMRAVRGVAVGPDDRIYVAGDQAIHVFRPQGELLQQIMLEGEPDCLAVGGVEHAFPGRIYVGIGGRLLVLDEEGKPAGAWDVPGDKPRLTSVAVAKQDVFAADCAGRVVLRYDLSGKLIGRIGRRDKARGIPGLVIPSPFFDVAVGPEDLLWVVNPGARRLEGYTFDGNLELFWDRQESAAIEGFFGCCNPAHLAVLPDDRFVTAEKGLLRVKVYSTHGNFECVVAGPEELDVPSARGTQDLFDHEYKAVDVAADSQGRVLILNPASRKVQVYELKKSTPHEKDKRSQ